jgi:hypothetical protein
MRLGISFAGVQISKFLDLQIKSYGKTKKLGAVRVGWACANQQELTTCAKNVGKKKENFARGKFRAPV